MKSYLELMQKVLEKGKQRHDRTGVGTLSLFSEHLSFDISEKFPAITTKKLFFKGVVVELLWFLRGDTNIKFLNDNNVRIWNSWGNHTGDLGPIYGKQWRDWNGNDQIKDVIREIKINPSSRRLIVSAWNVDDLPKMALAPCHVLSQFYVDDGKLSCQFYQRSSDVFLGLPFNIASYALLTHIIANQTGLKPGMLHVTIGDAHIYNNHVKQCELQLTRTPYELPKLSIGHKSSMEYYTPKDFWLEGYNYHPIITGEIAV